MLTQSPEPGARLQARAGDTIQFVLVTGHGGTGRAWLRTNLGRADRQRRAIITRVEQGVEPRGDDWHDIPMTAREPGVYAVRVPLIEPGIFEAKTLFQPTDAPVPQWPEGPNVYIKITAATTISSNTLYCAFARQFGPHQESEPGLLPDRIRCSELLDASGYTVIPKSGTFRGLMRELDTIMGRMRFRIIQLLPVFPTPTTYGRMGRFGSPFAVRDLMDIDPALAEFDRQATPFQQFEALVDAVHGRGGRVFLDIPINHTGWAGTLQTHHPEWYVRNADGSIQSPGAWGVTWEDLCKLDYQHRGLWMEMAQVFQFWCRHGVDGFRCDAGYMVPVSVWRYIVALVRRDFPDTTFLLEGLGGKFEVVTELLETANLDWAYSELFQNYDQAQVCDYLTGTMGFSKNRGLLVHFAETHDNNRLAATSRTYAQMRTTLSALCSDAGGFGITNGVEWFAERRVEVHGMSPLNWGAAVNQVDTIGRLNEILDTHPAFAADATLRLLSAGMPHAVILLRRAACGTEALVLVNLNTNEAAEARWLSADCDWADGPITDLISGRRVKPGRKGMTTTVPLAAGEALCLVYKTAAPEKAAGGTLERPILALQRTRAAVLALWGHFNPERDLGAADIDAWVKAFRENADAWIEDVAGGFAPITHWQWPVDAGRVVPWPRHHLLMVEAAAAFRVDLCVGERVLARTESLPQDGGKQMAVLLPSADSPETLTIRLRTFGTQPPFVEGQLHRAPLPGVWVKTELAGGVARSADSVGLCTNGRGAMTLARAAWGEIRSKYEALLAANLHPDFPVDRQVMLTRIRGWVLRRGYSIPVEAMWLERFSVRAPDAMVWDFVIPAGEGREISLNIRLNMVEGRNAIRLVIERCAVKVESGRNSVDDEPIRLILRPDVEDRSCHGVTQAYMGAERHFPASISAVEQGFTFAPSSHHRLVVHAEGADFHVEPEWRYMCPLPVEEERGLDRSTDVFSPGYFSCVLETDQEIQLHAEVLMEGERSLHQPTSHGAVVAEAQPPARVLKDAMRQFIVRRDNLKTVIAGYPWFLDWGRDTLICLRGMIAAGFLDEARDILIQFAGFEEGGTLPNMIRGSDHSNRDTSDAPLWFMVACEDLVRACPERRLLDEDCRGRPLRSILASIVSNYRDGTRNGIVMDPETGLIFSPAHYTWMDTNHPTGTARQGFPVEIQALWYAALRWMATLEGDRGWAELSEQVRASIQSLYVRPGQGYLSDCLHAERGVGARRAVADDALRCNQLFALTLGAVADPALAKSLLRHCEGLLIPGGIRTLADQPVKYPLPVTHGGMTLNDAYHPFWGWYSGDEDTRRKPAYHNGTAWTWPFPSYCEALVQVHGTQARDTAAALLLTLLKPLLEGCLGQIPEILDGAAPHRQKGCPAQAWGITECYRVLALLGVDR